MFVNGEQKPLGQRDKTVSVTQKYPVRAVKENPQYGGFEFISDWYDLNRLKQRN